MCIGEARRDELFEALKEIVLVAQGERRIDMWRKDEQGVWTLTEHRAGVVSLTSLARELPLDDVYRDPLAA